MKYNFNDLVYKKELIKVNLKYHNHSLKKGASKTVGFGIHDNEIGAFNLIYGYVSYNEMAAFLDGIIFSNQN